MARLTATALPSLAMSRTQSNSPETTGSVRATRLAGTGPVHVNHIAFIQSLPLGEFHSGAVLHGYVDGLVEEWRPNITTSLTHSGSAQEFFRAIEQLTHLAKTRSLRPVVHIEVHGNEATGLHFADDSSMSWSRLCEVLAGLNAATRYNLLVVVSACFGISLVQGVRTNRAAPCVAWIGPHHETDAAELLGRFRAFYRVLVPTLDMRQAIAALQKHSISGTQFDILTCEWWFEELMTGYLQELAEPAERKASVMRQYKALRERGIVTSLSEVKKMHRRHVPMAVLESFDAYFLFEMIPENRKRFAALRQQIQARLAVF